MRTITIISLLALSFGFAACDKDKKSNGGSTNPPVTTEGEGRGVIYYGSDSVVFQGICGGTNDLGYMVVAIQDATSSSKIMAITMDVMELPETTTTYTLSGNADAPNKVVLEGTIVNSTITGWNTEDGAGTITYVVNGNQITCNFSGIPVQPYALYNDPPYDVQGTAKGSFTFYR